MIVSVLLIFISPHLEQMKTGELLEKSSRVLTEDDKRLLEQEWVGKDGSKRKLEVRHPRLSTLSEDSNRLP